MSAYQHEIIFSDHPSTMLEVMDKYSADGWEAVNAFTYPTPGKQNIIRLNILIRKPVYAQSRR